MGKIVDFDEEGLPIPQKVKVPKSSVQFDEDGLPIPVKKKVSIADVGMAAKGGGRSGGSALEQTNQEKKPVSVKEKLSVLGIDDITFDAPQEETFIGGRALKEGEPAKSPFIFSGEKPKPVYIDINNPESLSYLSSRVKEAKQKADPYKYAAFADKSLGAKYNKDVADKQAKADEVMGEIAQAAAKNAFDKTISETPPAMIGRKEALNTGLEYLKQVDPAQHKRAITILEAGEDLGDEFKYNTEKIGASILQNNMQFVTDDQWALNNIAEINQLTDKAHPEIALAKGWDIIGAFNHKKDNRANNGFWRTRPSVGQVKQWLNDPELLSMFNGNEVALEQVKEKLSQFPSEYDRYKLSEVPVGGFLINLERAILGWVENIGNIVRSDAERQQSNLNPTLGRGSLTGNYRDPGESPALLQELFSLEAAEKDGTINEDEKEKLKALRASTKVRDGWDKFADGTGNATGQVFFQALGTKGLGLGTKIIPALEAGSATKLAIDAGITTALNTFDQSRQQAVYNFPDDKLKQNIYTGAMVLANSLSEQIFKDTKVLDAFKREIKGDLVNYVKNLSAENINKAAIKNIISDKLIKFAKETGVAANKEGFEEAIVQATDELSQYSLGAEGYESDKAMQRIGDTYTTTLLHGSIVSGLAARSNTKADKFNRVGVYRMATNPQIFEKEIQRQYEEGDITKTQKDEKLNILAKAAEIASAEPPKVSALSTKQRAEYLTQQLNIAVNESLLADAKDLNLQAELKTNIEESSKRAKEIYDGKSEQIEESELSEEQQIIKQALENNEISGVFTDIAKSAMQTPEDAKQFLTDAAEQVNTEVKPELGDSGETSKKTYGETITNYVRKQTPTALRDVESTANYLNVDDITKIENGKSIFYKIYKDKKEGDVFRGVESGNLIPENVFFVSDNPLVAKEYTRAENTSGKYGRTNDKYNKDAKFQRYSIDENAKVLDAKTIEGVNELRKILGLKPTDKFQGGWAKVYNLLDGISAENAKKIQDAGYDVVKIYEFDRDTGYSSVEGDSFAIINKDVLKENPLKSESLLSKEQSTSTTQTDIEAKKADIERRRQEELKRPYDNKNKELADANEIASYGETYSEALDNLVKKQSELNDVLNKRQKEDTKDRSIHQYTKEELEAQPEYQENKRLDGLINQINSVYGEAYGFDAKTSKGVEEIQQDIKDLPQKRKTANAKINAKYDAELKAVESLLSKEQGGDLIIPEKGVNLPRYGKIENISTKEDKGSSGSTQLSDKESQEKLNERYKRITDENDFVDPYDVAVKYFADGGKINPSELERIFGGKGDKGARISLMKNGSGTVKQIAHFLWESDQTGRYEDTHYIDAVESVLRDFSSQSAMKKDLADRFDFESASEKYMSQQYGQEAIDIVEGMNEDEINLILNLDANEEGSDNLYDYLDTLSQNKSKIAQLTEQRDRDIAEVSKPELNMEFVAAKELVDSKDPIGNKRVHADIKERFKKLKEIINCLHG